jgi:hypothetical protein
MWVMTTLRVRRTWWIMQRHAPEAPLFRVLARRWRPIDRRERQVVPFQLALAPPDAPPMSRAWFGPKRELAPSATQPRSARKWNPWMLMK